MTWQIIFGYVCAGTVNAALIYFSLRFMKLRQQRTENRRDNLARRLGT